MEKLIIESLGAAGIGGVLLLVLGFVLRHWFVERIKQSIKHEYDKDLKKLDDELRNKTDSELARLNARLSMELELAKLKLGPYSEKQFSLYNDLWLTLCGLRDTVRKLWDHANEDHLDAFANQLIAASKQLEASALLIEHAHYEELKGLLDDFFLFRIGKDTLLQYRKDRKDGLSVSIREIREMVDQNRQMKIGLFQKLETVMTHMRHQLTSTNNNAEPELGTYANKSRSSG